MLSVVRWTMKAWLLLAALPIVSLAQIPSGSSTYAAKVISLNGQVSLLKDSQEWALSVGDSVQVQQVIVSGPDGHAKFQVSDGSTFEVFPNSHVVFRKNPGSWRDLVDLIVGRIRVHIEKWGNQPNPNKVFTPSAVISVRGTTFDVVVNDEESTTVAVEEGEVTVQHALLPTGKPKVLNSGESVTVYRNEPIARATIDKGRVAQQVLRAVIDAISTVQRQGGGSTGSTGGGGGTGGTVGDKPAPTPPPPPPPTTGTGRP